MTRYVTIIYIFKTVKNKSDREYTRIWSLPLDLFSFLRKSPGRLIIIISGRKLLLWKNSGWLLLKFWSKWKRFTPFPFDTSYMHLRPNLLRENSKGLSMLSPPPPSATCRPPMAHQFPSQAYKWIFIQWHYAKASWFIKGYGCPSSHWGRYGKV